jgi:hypothetical protein
VDEALASGDMDFFRNHAFQRHESCWTVSEERGLCERGEPQEGFEVLYANSDHGETLPLEEYLAIIETLIARSIPSEEDDYGTSAARVHAVGVVTGVQEAPAFGTVVTALIERPADYGGSGPLRAVIILHWDMEDGQWRHFGMLHAFVTGEDYLEAEGGWLNPWERY